MEANLPGNVGVVVPRTGSAGWCFSRRLATVARFWALLLVAAGCASGSASVAGDDPRFLMSVEPGQSRSSIRGCLAEGSRAKSSSRSNDEPDGIDARVVAGGVLLTHNLTHACCLEANVRLTIHGKVATLHERLSGEPCRCECQSTIETGIGLGLGMWTLRVEVEEPFQPARIVDERRVKILDPNSETSQ